MWHTVPCAAWIRIQGESSAQTKRILCRVSFFGWGGWTAMNQLHDKEWFPGWVAPASCLPLAVEGAFMQHENYSLAKHHKA